MATANSRKDTVPFGLRSAHGQIEDSFQRYLNIHFGLSIVYVFGLCAHPKLPAETISVRLKYGWVQVTLDDEMVMIWS